MGDIDLVMEVLLAPNQSKGKRISAMNDMVALLEKQECLRDVLDECCERWSELTGLLWDESSDFTTKTTVSVMLARIGAVAVQCARLASSAIPSNILFAWIEPYFYKRSTSSEWPWNETVLLYMLDILRRCLADLEGSAFKASAPGLLNGCLAMLGSKDTPIGHFGALLEVLVQLTKVPSCIRPKFRDIVDLLVGWGVCSDTPPNARPKLIRAFQSLSFGWDVHTDLATSLLGGMAADLNTLIGSPIEPKDHTEFLNTGLCLAVMYESSGPFLSPKVFDNIPRIIELQTCSLVKYIPHITEADSPSSFAREMYAQTQTLISAIASKTSGNSGQENSVGRQHVLEGEEWAKQLYSLTLDGVNKKLNEVLLQPSKVASVLLIHAGIVTALQEHAQFINLEEKLQWLYGDHSVCFGLRFSHSKRVIQHLTIIYTTLSSWPVARLRRLFIEIFLQDLQPHLAAKPGARALPLVPPTSAEAFSETLKATGGGGGGGGGQSLGSGNRSNGSEESTSSSRQDVRKALFSCAILTHLVQMNLVGDSHRDDIQRVWDVVSVESTKPGAILQHKKVVMRAVSLLRTVFRWKKDDGNSSSNCLGSALDFIQRLLGSGTVSTDMDLTILLMEWVKQVVSVMKPPSSLEPDLVELIIRFARHHDPQVRCTTGEVLCTMTSSCLILGGSTLLKLASLAAECSSDTQPEVSVLYRQLLTNLSPYALLMGAKLNDCHRDSIPLWSKIALQSQTHALRANQLATFLQHLYQTSPDKGPSMRLLQGSKNEDLPSIQEWIHGFCHGLSLLKDSELEWENHQPLVDGVAEISVEQMSCQTAVWFLVHEAARNLVGSRFRLCSGGPSQFFTSLDGALSFQVSKLSEGAQLDLQSTWMLLEFISALEKKCFCGYEGSEALASPPRNTWQFYLSNRKVFVEWFARLRPKLLFISQKIGHHHYCVHIGMLRISQFEAEQRNLVTSGSDEIPDEACSSLTSQLSDALMHTSLSLCKLQESSTIKGLHKFILERSPPFLMPPSNQSESLTETPAGWMHGLALQASGRYEEAVYAYNEYYNYARMQSAVLSGMTTENHTNMEDRQKYYIAKTVAKDFQPFVQERIAECFHATAEWKGYQSFVQVVEQQSPITNSLWWKLRRIELSAVYDSATAKEALNKLSSWAPESNTIGVDEALEFGEVCTLQALIYAGNSGSGGIGGDIPSDKNVRERKLAPAMEILAQNDPTRLSMQLLSLHGLKCASKLVNEGEASQEIDASTRIMTVFDILSGKQLEGISYSRGLGMLKALVPEISDQGFETKISSQLSVLDILKLTRIQRAATGELAPLLLLGCRVARENGNMRLAGRFMNDEVMQHVQSAWMRALAVLENREILLRGCPIEDASKILTQWWEATVWGLRNIPNDDASRTILAVSLIRLSTWLASGHAFGGGSGSTSNSRPSFELDIQFISDQLGDRWSQVNLAAGGDVIRTFTAAQSTTRVAQAVCITASTVVAPNLPAVWQRFGHMLYSITEESKLRVGLNGSNTSSNLMASYRHAINAYCKNLQLQGRASDYFTLLRLHDCIHTHGHCLLDDELMKNLMGVPATAWCIITLQVFTQLSNPSPQVRQCILQILKAVSRVDMSSVLYPAVVEKRRSEFEGDQMTQELQALLADLNGQYPSLCKDLDVMLDEMERLTVLWVEQWHSTLAELHLDVNRRIVTFQAEMGRLQKNDQLDQDQRAAITQQRFGTLFSPVFLVLEKRLKSTLSREPQTPNEQEFHDRFAGQLAESIGKFKDLVVVDASHARGLWLPLKNLLRDMDKHLKVLKLKMAFVSPRLTSLAGTNIPMPGCKGGQITINGFGPDVLVLSTKTRPKKLEMIGSDGHEYSYLLKGRDDLHMDQRLMQFVNATNSLLVSDKRTASQEYCAREYSVMPLGGRVGLIQWVSGTVSLYGIFRAWQKNQQDKIEAVNAAQDVEVKKHITIPPAAQMRPTDLFYTHLFPELNKANITRGSSSRKDWPLDVMLKVFQILQDHIPSRLLASELWCGSASSSAWWERMNRYINSSSVTSMIGFILGLGDRHLDNLLINKVSAEVVHIDYDVCFEKGANFRIPEVVPFRMTRTMQVAMGVGGLRGSFYSACIDVMRVLRSNKDALWMLLEAILHDPIVDWAADRHERAARKGMDLAVNLQLFESRCEELRGSLEVPRQELILALELCAEYIQGSTELHSYMYDVREKMQASTQKISEAQTMLSSLASEEVELNKKCTEPQELHDKHILDLQKLQESIQQVLSHCHQWAFRHSRVLENLSNPESPTLMPPNHQWRSQSTTTSLELVKKSNQFQSPPIMEATFGVSHTKAGLTPEIVRECTSVDEQGANLLPLRDNLVWGIKKTMQEYAAILQHLLSENYIAASHHCGWMLVFQTALSGSPVESVISAKRLAPKEVTEAEVEFMWRALTRSYAKIENYLEKAKEPPKVVPALVQVEQDAALQSSNVQSSLVSDWGVGDVHQALGNVLKKVLEDLTLLDDHPENAESCVPLGDSDVVTQWTRKIFGLAQLFRLLRANSVGQGPPFSNWHDEDSNLIEPSTGFSWLDALEKFTSTVALAFRNLRTGFLLDLSTFLEDGPISYIQEFYQKLQDHFQELQSLAQKSWDLESLRVEQEGFVSSYEEKVARVIHGLEDVNMKAAKSLVTGPELQELANQQQILTKHLQEMQARWENRESINARLSQEEEALRAVADNAVSRFLAAVKGLANDTVNPGQENDANNLKWGQMEFSVCHASIEPLNLLVAAEVQVGVHLSRSGDASVSCDVEDNSDPSLRSGGEKNGCQFPPGWEQYACHSEHASWLSTLVCEALSDRMGSRQILKTGVGKLEKVLNDLLLKGADQKLRRVAGRLMKSKLTEMSEVLLSGNGIGNGDLGNTHLTRLAEAVIVESENDEGDIYDGDEDGTLGLPEASNALDIPEEIWSIMEAFQSCIESQGLYAHSALFQRSRDLWKETMASCQAIRLRNLAAFQWLYDDILSKIPGLGSSRHLTTYLKQISQSEDIPSDMIENPIGRHQSLAILQNALQSLSQTQSSILEWSKSGVAASQNIFKNLQQASLSDGRDKQVNLKVLQGYLNHRTRWLDTAFEHADSVNSLGNALLQFEYSTKGVLWNPGEAPSSQSFTDFSGWLLQTVACVEGLKASEESLSEYQSKSADLVKLASQATALLQSAQEEELSAAKELSESTTPYLQAVSDAAQALGNLSHALAASRGPIEQDLGPLLKELSSITFGHKVTRDAHELVQRVLTEYSGLEQTIDKVAPLAPSLAEKLTKAINPVLMDPRNSDETTDTAALCKRTVHELLDDSEIVPQLRDLTTAALQAFTSLGNIYNALDSLMEATKSIAAALQSEHGLDDETADLDGQLESVRFHQVAENQTRVLPLGNEPDGKDELCIATNRLFLNLPKEPAVIKTTIRIDENGQQIPCEPDGQELSESGPTGSAGIHTGITPQQQVLLASSSLPSAGQEEAFQSVDGGDCVSDAQKTRVTKTLEGSYQSKISRTMSQEQKSYVTAVSRRCLAKLEGRDNDSLEATMSSVEDQVNQLLKQATNLENLCRMYEGWTPWI